MSKLIALKFYLLIPIAISLVLFGCNSNDTNVDSSRVSEVIEVLKSVPVHPSKVEVNTDDYSYESNASITRKYKSDTSYEEVKKFYLAQLGKQGWQLIEERELKDKGRFKGEQVLHFTRGEFLLSVQFAGQRKETLGWDYAIRIAYPPDWIEKI